MSLTPRPFSKPHLKRFQVQINDGRNVKRKQLRNYEAADYCQSKWLPCLATSAQAKRNWKCAHQRCHGGHHDWPKTEQAALINGFKRSFALALRLNCKIDHHDGVLFNDADQHDKSDKSINVQIKAENHQSQQRAKSSGGQAGKDRNRMDETFVKDAENDVNDDDGHEQENSHPFDR